MSPVRSVAFQTSQPAVFPVTGRRRRPSWVHPDAVFALDGKNSRYWRRQGGILPDTSLLSVTRASGINLPDAAGIYQALGNNSLPRTDRGVYPHQQLPALNANGNNPQSATGWTVVGGASVSSGPVIDGFFQSAYVASGGGRNDSRRTAAISISSGVPVAIRARFGPGTNDSGRVRVHMQNGSVLSVVAGVRGAMTSDTTAGGTFTIVAQTTTEALIIWTPNATSASAYVGCGPDTTTSGQNIRVDGLDVVQANFVPAAWISTSSPAPTLLASDISAITGIRPSNGQPDPFPGWEAFGLDSAFRPLANVRIDRLSGANPRTIAVAGADANNNVRLNFDTDNRFKLIVRKSGSDVLTLQSGVASSTGLYALDARAKPGDYALPRRDFRVPRVRAARRFPRLLPRFGWARISASPIRSMAGSRTCKS